MSTPESEEQTIADMQEVQEMMNEIIEELEALIEDYTEDNS